MSSSDDDGVPVGDGPAPRVVTHTFVETTGNPGPTEGMFIVPADDPEYPNAKPLATVIPMYNEPVPELWHSLKDLSEQGRVMLKAMLDLVLHVVIVLDGAEMTHRSTHEWLMTVFPPDEVANEGDPTWVQILEDAAEGEDGNGRPLDEHGRPVPFTVVVTRVLETDPDHRPVPVTFSKPDYEGKGDSNLNGCEGQTLELRLTLVIKLDNRKKANTHKYFLADDVGFGATLRSEYLFLTDCGTRFNRDCLLRLCNYLADHGRCAAVTGRQRVMNRRQEESSEGLLSMTFLGRISNLCNYEGSFAVFNGAFALFGLLPVIPGPCGLFRASCLRGEPLAWYFEQTDKKVEQCTQVQAVGHLAEDRYLPVAALLFGALPENIRSDFGCASFLYIGLEPRATFGFQQEPSFERWCGQMRRWIAGAAAFYLDILYNHYADIWNSQRMARVSKIAMFTFYSAQLFVYGQMAFTPALFLLTLKRALDSMSDNFLSSGSMYEAPSHAIVAASNLTFGNDTAGGMNATLMPEDTGLFGGDTSSSLGSDLNEISYSYTDNIGLESYLNFSNTVWFAVCGLYVLFVAKHVDRHTKPIRWLFAPLGLMGAVAILCGVIGFVSYMCSNLSPGLLPGSEMSGQHSWEWLASTTVMVATLIPIPLAFLYSPWSAFLLTVSMPVFFLLLPTSVALFGSYAFSRLADLGWGSREVADEYTGVSDELKEKEREFDANGRMIAALIVIGNLLLCVFVLSTVGNSLYLCVVVFFVFGFALFHEVFSLIYVLWHLANRWTSQILWDQCCSTRRNRHVANHYEHTGYRLIPGNDA